MTRRVTERLLIAPVSLPGLGDPQAIEADPRVFAVMLGSSASAPTLTARASV